MTLLRRPHRNGTRPNGWSSDEWATPPDFVRALEREFGRFTLDPCARPETAKAPRFYTRADDGLTKPWTGRVWLNPPYSRPGPWVARAVLSTALAGTRCTLVVALLPSSTDTGWFHDSVLGKAEIRWLRGRVRFLGWHGTPIGSPRDRHFLAIYRRREQR